MFNNSIYKTKNEVHPRATSANSTFHLQDNRPASVLQRQQSGIFTGPVMQLNARDRKKAKARARAEQEKMRITSKELKRIRQIAATVTASTGMDCDRWAADFQAALEADESGFVPKVLIVRPDKKINAGAGTAEIHYEGNKIGSDTHFYTVVSINGTPYSFDNVSPKGVEEKQHRKRTKVFFDKGSAWEPKLEKQNKGKHLIEENIRAEQFRRGDTVTKTIRRLRPGLYK